MGNTPESWAIAALAATLAAAAVTDVKAGRILNAVTYPAIAIGLLGQTYLHGWGGLAQSLGGFAAGFGPLLACWALGGIGGGDAKLMGAVGALTNWQFALAAMICGFAVGAIMAVGVMVRRRIVRRTMGRIWRALCLALVPGVKGDWPAEADSPKIPFGLALCIGAAAALADSLLGGPIARGLL